MVQLQARLSSRTYEANQSMTGATRPNCRPRTRISLYPRTERRPVTELDNLCMPVPLRMLLTPRADSAFCYQAAGFAVTLRNSLRLGTGTQAPGHQPGRDVGHGGAPVHQTALARPGCRADGDAHHGFEIGARRHAQARAITSIGFICGLAVCPFRSFQIVVSETRPPVVRSIRPATSALLQEPRPAGRALSMSQFTLSARGRGPARHPCSRWSAQASPHQHPRYVPQGRPGVPPRRLTGLRASPQNPHKPASAAAIPTENPRTKRHYPAQDGTAASMTLLALTGLYAGSAGLTILKLPVVRSGTDLLLNGSSQAAASDRGSSRPLLASPPRPPGAAGSAPRPHGAAVSGRARSRLT